MPYGKIFKWDEDRGFGFVSDDQAPYGGGYFVHISALKGRAPEVGDAFEYDVVTGMDGRTRTANLRPLRSAAEEEADRVFGRG